MVRESVGYVCCGVDEEWPHVFVTIVNEDIMSLGD